MTLPAATRRLFPGYDEADLAPVDPGRRGSSPLFCRLLGDLLALDRAAESETGRESYLFDRHGLSFEMCHFFDNSPLREPYAKVSGLAVASAVDLGLIKLAAIIIRGTRRDFVDLYLLC